VKHIALSDFTEEQLSRLQAERDRKYATAVEEYEGRLEARQARIDALMGRRRRAQQQRMRLRAALYVCRVLFARLGKMREALRGKPARQQAGVEDVKWANGHEGEERVRHHLGLLLDDTWTMITGYHNPSGEIDALLAGPAGIYAMEVKNLKGIIECDGDDWWRQKYDRWGNLVRSHEPIADKGGRGPSKQLNEPADRLEAFLSRTLRGNRIYRAVVFSEETAIIGEAKNVTVDAVVLLRGWDVQATLHESQIRWTPEEIDRVVRQIVRDHSYWEKRRNGRRTPDPTKGGPAPSLAPTT
jgi:hypothetical protein